MLSDQFLQMVGAWTVVIGGGFLLFCVFGVVMELFDRIGDGYRWLRRRIAGNLR